MLRCGLERVVFSPQFLLLMDGHSRPEVAYWLCQDEEATHPWMYAFHAAGVPARSGSCLRGTEPGSRPSNGHRSKTRSAAARKPRAFICVWTTTKFIRHFISTRLSLEYCRERAGQRLYAPGCRWHGLRHWLLRAKPEEEAAFRAELEARLVG